MSSVRIAHLNKVYPNGFVSVKDVSLDIQNGELITLHGPHGCGKSTILRMIGGLESVTSGKVYFGEDCITDMPPANRPLAMLFQNYVIYKQITVFENIALGLRIREYPRHIIERRVKHATDFMGITSILHKRIKHISRLEQQQVAICRAMVCKPAVLLVDEEFAHHFEEQKKDLLLTLERLNSQKKLTILYVTNNYKEATTIGRRVVFMKDGSIEEIRYN